MRDSDCSVIYKVSPVVVKPQLNTKARCPSSTCRKLCLFGACNCSVFSRTQVLVLENSRASPWNESRMSLRSSSKKNCNSNYLIGDENDDPGSFKDLSQSRIFKPKETYPAKMNLKAKSFQDASTHTDIPPETETINAYFAEHRTFDYIGNSFAMGTLITILWYTFEWYVWFIEKSYRW